MAIRKKVPQRLARIFQYRALAFSQRGVTGPKFLVFHAPAEEIKLWADVDRMSTSNPKGAQRPLRPMKANKIARYLLANPKNTIPTAVIVALDKGTAQFAPDGSGSRKSEHGFLKITVKKRKKPGLIIDGQHRVFGAAAAGEKIELNVVALFAADDTERAFQFVVINNSANRVSPDHIKALNLSYNQEQLNARLLASARLGLKEDLYDDLQVIDRGDASPFLGLLKWGRNADGFIVPSAVEGALKETKNRCDLLGIKDLEVDFFLFVWNVIKRHWPALWKSDSHLLEKVSIQALTIFVLENLISLRNMSDSIIDYANEDTLQKHVLQVIKKIPGDFWKAEWSATELDTRLGHDMLLRTLTLIAANERNGRAWYEGLEIIKPADVGGIKKAKKPRA